jgi:ketol-acid reductoisomerase
VLASLLAAQAEEIRNMRASAATAAEAKTMRALRDDADAAAKEAFKRAAIETDRASFLELALQQERRERERLKETLEHAHRQKTSELERDHARDPRAFRRRGDDVAKRNRRSLT